MSESERPMDEQQSERPAPMSDAQWMAAYRAAARVDGERDARTLEPCPACDGVGSTVIVAPSATRPGVSVRCRMCDGIGAPAAAVARAVAARLESLEQRESERLERMARAAERTPAPNAPAGTRVRELRTGAVGTIVGASSAALMVRLETGPEASERPYGIHPSELELISDSAYVAARYSAASAPQRPALPVGTRVQLAPHTDAWMAGDRYGVTEGELFRTRDGLERYRVRFDVSGRVRGVLADELSAVSR